MVGRLTVSDRLPASLTSAPYSRTSIGISSSPPATPRSGAAAPIASPATAPAAAWGRAGEERCPGSRVVPEQQDRRDRDEQHGDDAVQPLGTEARRPAGAEPGSEEAAREQLRDRFPARGDGGERHRRGPERQGRGHDDEAHRLIEDDRLERREAEGADQQRQPELRPA